MLRRLRSTWLAGGGAILLTLSISGVAAGAVIVAHNVDLVDEPVGTTEATTDTTLTFEDLDGNGVDDDCQAPPAEADPGAVLVALTTADLDHDGAISVPEAAQSDWVGGKNCNHGGYVSSVARGSDDAEDDTDAEPAGCGAPAVQPAVEEDASVDTAPNAHGKAVSKVAQSDAVGGKNCNHGGAVSEAAKKDHDEQHGNAAKKAAGKAHDEQHGNAAKKAAGKAHGNGQSKGKGHSEP